MRHSFVNGTHFDTKALLRDPGLSKQDEDGLPSMRDLFQGCIVDISIIILFITLAMPVMNWLHDSITFGKS